MSDVPGSDQLSNIAGQGTSAINNFDPTATANSVRSGFDTLTSNQIGSGGPSTLSDYMKAYSGQVAANPSVTSLYNASNANFGVPQLASRANTLNTMVTNEVPNAYSAARGFDFSDPQVQNKIATDLRFLSPQATAATNESQTAQTLAGQQVQAGITQNQMNLLPIQSYGPMLNDTLARQATGYTTVAQQQFEALTAKMTAGVQLSESEMQQFASLQNAQTAYTQAIDSAKIGSGAALAPNQTYYNPFYTGSTYNPNRKVA